MGQRGAKSGGQRCPPGDQGLSINGDRKKSPNSKKEFPTVDMEGNSFLERISKGTLQNLCVTQFLSPLLS